MTMTTRVLSVTIPVADQDQALRFYTEVLGCELRTDIEVWPGARLVEVVPPGSTVGLVLLPPDGEIPVAVRLGTTDAETAHMRACAKREPRSTTTMWCTLTALRRCFSSLTRMAMALSTWRNRLAAR